MTDCLRSGGRLLLQPLSLVNQRRHLSLEKGTHTKDIEASHALLFFCQRNMPSPIVHWKRQYQRNQLAQPGKLDHEARNNAAATSRLGYFSLFLACRPCSLRLGRIGPPRMCCRLPASGGSNTEKLWSLIYYEKKKHCLLREKVRCIKQRSSFYVRTSERGKCNLMQTHGGDVARPYVAVRPQLPPRGIRTQRGAYPLGPVVLVQV